MSNNEKTVACLMALKALADAIKELGQVPSGHLYAQVMGQVDLTTFNGAIEVLCNSTLVKKQGDMLIWNG